MKKVIYGSNDIEITNDDSIRIGENVLINEERFKTMQWYIKDLTEAFHRLERKLDATQGVAGDKLKGLKYLDKFVRYTDGELRENESFGVWVDEETYFEKREDPLA